MAKKKTYKTKSKPASVDEPEVAYSENRIHIFNSFEEQADFELKEMAALSSEEVLQDLRKFINIAYGMHGYDPDKLPKKHTIQIIQKG